MRNPHECIRCNKYAAALAGVTAQRDAAEANLARLQRRWDERPLSAGDQLEAAHDPETEAPPRCPRCTRLLRPSLTGTLTCDVCVTSFDQPPTKAVLQQIAELTAAQPEAITSPEDMSMAERIGDTRIDGAADNSETVVCNWRCDADGIWYGDCGVAWLLEYEPSPAKHDMAYCPKCGKPLVEHAYIEPPVCGECGEELVGGRCPECTSDNSRTVP